MKERENKILELLAKDRQMNVSKLSDILGVSCVTVRKDLSSLEDRGIIKREHGFARIGSDDDLNSRLAYHYDAKLKIAKKAAEYVHNGDTVMIESGSCCALLAEELVKTKKDLTVITNSCFIASYTRGSRGFQIILLGGIYQKDSQVNVGPLVCDCVKNFLVDMFFIGTDGYDINAGFTNRDQLRAQAVNDMSMQAENVMILTEGEKFSKRGTVPLRIDKRKITVITDNNISEAIKQHLSTSEIRLVCVG